MYPWTQGFTQTKLQPVRFSAGASKKCTKKIDQPAPCDATILKAVNRERSEMRRSRAAGKGNSGSGHFWAELIWIRMMWTYMVQKDVNIKNYKDTEMERAPCSEKKSQWGLHCTALTVPHPHSTPWRERMTGWWLTQKLFKRWQKAPKMTKWDKTYVKAD